MAARIEKASTDESGDNPIRLTKDHLRFGALERKFVEPFRDLVAKADESGVIVPHEMLRDDLSYRRNIHWMILCDSLGKEFLKSHWSVRQTNVSPLVFQYYATKLMKVRAELHAAEAKLKSIDPQDSTSSAARDAAKHDVERLEGLVQFHWI